MASRNMHAVEELVIGNLYDKARYHKLVKCSDNMKFYYTRKVGGAFENMAEMMGTRNVLRWFVPIPYYNRQYPHLVAEEGQTPPNGRDIDFMRFDRETLRDLVKLEYQIEKKVEDELIASGFKLRKRT